MMRAKSHSSILDYLYKPLCVLCLLGGLFGLVWLRSSVVSITYDIRGLEEKKIAAIRESKLLLADRSNLMSLGNLNASASGDSFREADFRKASASGKTFVFPDRQKVTYIKTRRETEHQTVSYDAEKKQ